MEAFHQDDRRLYYIRSVWPILPLHELYSTTDSQSLYAPYRERMFVYSIYRVKDVTPTLMEGVESNHFRIYTMKVLGYREPVGYLFIPNNLSSIWEIRFTYCMISVTNRDMTRESVEASGKIPILSTEYFEVLKLTCGCEVIHTLGSAMGVSLTESE